MNRSLVGWIAAAVLAVALAALAWLFFAGGSGEPSTELTTPPIADEPTSIGVPDTGGTTTSLEAGTTTTTAPDSATGGVVTFVLDPAQTVASFEIDEVLRGNATQAVGSTSEVAGQLEVDLADLSSVRFSQVVINARTFRTDSSFRDRAIRGPVILNSASDEHELITFDITSVEVSGAAEVGATLGFTVTGDLRIRDATRETTFDMTATLEDESMISGTAQATVLREDFGIGIPNAPGVASVGEEVMIRLDFVATSG